MECACSGRLIASGVPSKTNPSLIHTLTIGPGSSSSAFLSASKAAGVFACLNARASRGPPRGLSVGSKNLDEDHCIVGVWFAPPAVVAGHVNQLDLPRIRRVRIKSGSARAHPSSLVCRRPGSCVPSSSTSVTPRLWFNPFGSSSTTRCPFPLTADDETAVSRSPRFWVRLRASADGAQRRCDCQSKCRVDAPVHSSSLDNPFY